MNCLEIHQLNFSYPGGRRVFRDLNLSVQSGEKAALTGANGAGKSTLFQLLTGLLKPQSGSIVAWGKTVASEEEFRQMRRRTGLMFQDPDDQLICPSVEEDIAFTLLNHGMPPREVAGKVDEICRKLGLAALKTRVPFHLSWGQKQLVSLAGILVTEPQLLLLDEPTAGADDHLKSLMLDHLQQFTGTLLVSSHDSDFLERLCSSAYHISNGSVMR
ncbi:ABC transporter ATP-binding protein [Prosthecochloris sp. N3]|uniref:ABC transporter ATP-binding protein n=1 Tax=Prosthecochloris ethylica TaxID=2743976 RepID=A0ABR9XT10_9CHLB|nr:ABC transporter ATP-binding protein [Prosthecochloris ethylica]MBF0585375.1 ABC transporter ATP-binding protein [Prosthecochloris ethylica]MBF0636911.1 ABC transporter ATP-binding protein [Prosthecochloris ethylica]MEC9487049.1 ABC transporter ATP-binding protein [Prosthecochloris sp.]NUK46604.1 ABC transporter ATP-binding protein [Prosthecochloris ethylica]